MASNCQSVNTFASQHLVFEGKNEPFLLEITSNLTQKKLAKFSWEKYHTKTHVLYLMHF